jgi:hypothetical protein
MQVFVVEFQAVPRYQRTLGPVAASRNAFPAPSRGECGDAEVVIGPPDDVDLVLAGLREVRRKAGQPFTEPPVNVHRHADRLERPDRDVGGVRGFGQRAGREGGTDGGEDGTRVSAWSTRPTLPDLGPCRSETTKLQPATYRHVAVSANLLTWELEAVGSRYAMDSRCMC